MLNATGSVTWLRRRAMKILARFVRSLIRQDLTDTSSGFRGFSRRSLDYFAQTYPIEYLDSVEALVMAHSAGLAVGEAFGVQEEIHHGL